MIRVLIAEDSSTFRELLSAILREDGTFAIVGTAVNGLEAVEMTQRLKPDIVMMDINMPGIDGVKATQRIMESTPTPIVVVTASGTFTDVAVTFNAMNAGALAVLRKPSGPGSPKFAEESRKIVSTVRAMAGVKVIRRHRLQRDRRDMPVERVVQARIPTGIVAIAASTGGPAAVRLILAGLNASLPVPILLVQHIAEGFASGLVDWLGAATSLNVKLGVHGEVLVAGTIYVAPDGAHLGASRDGRAVLSDAPPVGEFRPSATFLFESVATAYGAATLAVVLTGMGDDGTAGLQVVKARGGLVLAQDEASCVVFGMPAKAIAAGVVDAILPLDEIAGRISRAITRG